MTVAEQELPFIKAIDKRIEPSREVLRSHLEIFLADALSESNSSASFTLLHAFSLAGDVRAGEQVVRYDEIVFTLSMMQIMHLFSGLHNRQYIIFNRR